MQETGLPKVYDPKKTEDKWYSYWEEKGFFHQEVDKSRKPFCIVIPPPNVTGQLHMGHAWDNTLQDILIRWHRMKGENTVWIPGTDHAGIATQAKVEEHLAKEGLSKYDLGRKKFLERVWAWKEEYGGRIITQLKKLGASCDWHRERFTMDEGCSRAVREVFVSLYEKGLIYRDYRIINYCPNCNTTLSDIEVEHRERPGNLWHIKYPFADGTGYITVATTRPETMLGDTAVAVHPEDERYKDLVGRTVILPLMNREIPIIADSYVDKEFGSGAVKITPAHDPNDYEIGLRHDLPKITVIGKDGRMTKEAGVYAGLDRYEARERVVSDLEADGYLVKTEEHSHAVGECYRCGTVVEPLISKQWFVKMEPLAKPAIQVVKEGKIRFVPERFSKIYLNWVENIRDWCISRQLWWGHRIPVWYCQECGEVIVSRQDPTECTKCGSSQLEQDPDVLDTWFSSALWPFSTMGWPEETAELEHFYPTSVLVTGFDIIFFWVARMIFMGLEFRGEIPFHEVYIHGLIRDAQGRKMSKSLGNGIDPLKVITEYGADALRFSLVTGVAPGYDMKFRMEQVEASRNFANKIWNAARFVLMNLADYSGELPELKQIQELPLELPDRWILDRYAAAAAEVNRQLTRYDLGEAAKVLYEFIWNDYCDWYIELVKGRLYGKSTAKSKETAQAVLMYVLEGTMRLLHPFMPFITEEIWQQLPAARETIMLQPYPSGLEALGDRQAAEALGAFIEIVRSIRNARAEAEVPLGKKIEAILLAEDPLRGELEKLKEEFLALAGLSRLSILPIDSEKPEKAMSALAAGVQIYLPLSGMVDIDKELERLQRERDKLVQEVARGEQKLANKAFVTKAPAQVVEKERAKLEKYRADLAKIKERIAEVESLR
ncbi:MAG: valine--tRNA ligase [Firmicutes bacterium]|nr:valine--tRNA ligase [Bacillota bacterium]